MSEVVIEAALLKIGQAVAKQIALNWFAQRKGDSRRGKDLSQLIQARFPMRRDERAVLDALVRIEDDVADQLGPGVRSSAHGLPDNERQAALNAVSDALAHADLSDVGLFNIDLNPASLAASVCKQWPVERLGLSERAVRLYELALDRACIVLVHLIRELPEFNPAIAIECLGRLRLIRSQLDQVLNNLPARQLDAPSGTTFDDQFRREYLDLVSRSYNQLEVIGLTTHSYEPRTTLSVAYLSLTVTADSRRRPQDSDLAAMNWLQGNRQNAGPAENLRVESALGDSKRTVIRGEAGAGKSTLLRWLAVNAGRGTFTDRLVDWNDCVPVLVKLRDFSDLPLPRGDELLRQPSSPQCGPVPAEWVHRQFDSGRALLLVDGVDELSRSRRDKVRSWCLIQNPRRLRRRTGLERRRSSGGRC